MYRGGKVDAIQQSSNPVEEDSVKEQLAAVQELSRTINTMLYLLNN